MTSCLPESFPAPADTVDGRECDFGWAVRDDAPPTIDTLRDEVTAWDGEEDERDDERDFDEDDESDLDDEYFDDDEDEDDDDDENLDLNADELIDDDAEETDPS